MLCARVGAGRNHQTTRRARAREEMRLGKSSAAT